MTENCHFLPFSPKTSILDLHKQKRLDQADDTSIHDMRTVYPHTNSMITLFNACVFEWFKVA
jgi:hypothetical protein